MLAVTEGEGESLQSRLALIELSLQVAVTKGVEGKIGWHVLELGRNELASTQMLSCGRNLRLLRQTEVCAAFFTVSDRSE